MAMLGEAGSWQQAFADGAEPPFRLSSLFLFAGRTLFVPPPGSLWPPPASPRLRWKVARFVPLSVVADLALGKPIIEERWEIDPRSQCLIAAGTTPPVRLGQRRRAAIDREAPGYTAPHTTACLEFAANAGLWTVVVFADDAARSDWEPRLRAAFRLLADEGVGGERSTGMGRAESVEFQPGAFPQLLSGVFPAAEAGSGYWLLSLFHPAESDTIDWSVGSYSLTERAARGSAWVRMAAEGSVLRAETPPRGHFVALERPGQQPARRAGFAVAIPLPAPPSKEEAA